MLADQATQHPIHFRDDAIEIEHFRLQHLPAAIREQLSRQRCRPLGGLANLLNVRSLRIARWQIAEQELRVAENGGEQVVEVVGNAAGELADGFHLLGLPELLLEVALLADVPLGAPDTHQPALLDEADDVIKEDAGSPIAGALAGFRIGQPISRPDERPDLLAVRGIADVMQVGETRAHEVPGFVIAIHPGHRVVALRDAGPRIQSIDLLVLRQRHRNRWIDLEPRYALGRLRNESAVALLAAAHVFDRQLQERALLAQRVFAALALDRHRHLRRDESEEVELALTVAHPRRVCLRGDDADRAVLDRERHAEPIDRRRADQLGLARRYQLFMDLRR